MLASLCLIEFAHFNIVMCFFLHATHITCFVFHVLSAQPRSTVRCSQCSHPDGWHRTWASRRSACINNYHFFFLTLSGVLSFVARFSFIKKKKKLLSGTPKMTGGDCTTVATQPRQLQQFIKIQKKKKKKKKRSTQQLRTKYARSTQYRGGRQEHQLPHIFFFSFLFVNETKTFLERAKKCSSFWGACF